MTIRYLSRGEIADKLGVSLDAIKKAQARPDFPKPDALVGRNQGWLETTIEHWHANRPGRGARTDLD